MSDLPATPPDAEADRIRALGAGFLALQEALQANRALQAELQRMRASQSWRLTAPLRRLRAALGPAPSGLLALRPAQESGGAEDLADPSELLRSRALPSVLRGPEGPDARKMLYVDVTELDREDHGAGVQRVVRRVLGQWLVAPPAGFRVEPVRLSSDAGYVHARDFLARLLGMAPGEAGPDRALRAKSGDHFLGLDLIRERASLAGPALEALKTQGVALAFVVYDLLPLQRPDWFPPRAAERFSAWLQLVARVSDRLLCISDSVAKDLQARLAAQALPRVPRIASFPLGSDLETFAAPRTRRERRAGEPLRVLMVGTVEPRKGHEQALAAFDLLWRRGHALELLIAGRPGWMVPALLQRLRSHPESDRRLHWIDSADDAALLACYRGSDLLLAASLGEGYGLPLVEAASQGLPILARDLPVFREVAGAGADYFQGESAEALAAAIEGWMERRRQAAIADPASVRRLDWRAASDTLRIELLKD